MKLQAQAQAKLRALMEGGALAASQCGQAFLRLLAPMIDSGALEYRRSGAGRRLVVSNAGALREFYGKQFPEAILPEDAEGRVAGVGQFRDSKAAPNTGSEILSVRAWNDQALLKCGEPAGAAAATERHGVFSFLLANESPYRLNGAWMLVENPAVFAGAERLGLRLDAAIYGHGRISNRALDWMARAREGSFVLVHLPDYDPAGLSEFERIRARLGPRASLHAPPDLEARFERFSNRALLRKRQSQAMLARLRRSELPAIRRVVELIDRHNAGLEQEALLIPL